MNGQQLLSFPACVLAVDPGLSGAVCRLGGGLFDVRRDFKRLPDIATAIREMAKAGVISYAVMELVHAMPGQGVCSMFSFGRAAGVADGALALIFPNLTVEYVAPLKWQNFFRARFHVAKGQEFDSRDIACRIFPAYTGWFKRKKDHNSADAALMAVWKIAQLSEHRG